MQQSGWKDRRPPIGLKSPKRREWYKSSPTDEEEGETHWKKTEENKRAHGCIRFLTLSRNNGWVIYGETWHIWDDTPGRLPDLLVRGLEMGKKSQWIINVGFQNTALQEKAFPLTTIQKVELSLFNEEEFVLVYDNGHVFYHIASEKFVRDFKIVVQEWAGTKNVGRVIYHEDETGTEEATIEKPQAVRGVQSYAPHDDDESIASRRKYDKTPSTSTGETNLDGTTVTASQQAGGDEYSGNDMPGSYRDNRAVLLNESTQSQARTTAGTPEPGQSSRDLPVGRSRGNLNSLSSRGRRQGSSYEITRGGEQSRPRAHTGGKRDAATGFLSGMKNRFSSGRPGSP